MRNAPCTAHAAHPHIHAHTPAALGHMSVVSFVLFLRVRLRTVGHAVMASHWHSSARDFLMGPFRALRMRPEAAAVIGGSGATNISVVDLTCAPTRSAVTAGLGSCNTPGVYQGHVLM